MKLPRCDKWILLLSACSLLAYWVFWPKDWSAKKEIQPNLSLWIRHPYRPAMLRVYEVQEALGSPGLPAGYVDYMNRVRPDERYSSTILDNMRYANNPSPFARSLGWIDASTRYDFRFVNFIGMYWHVVSPGGYPYIVHRKDFLGMPYIWIMDVHGEIVYCASSTDELRTFMHTDNEGPQEMNSELFLSGPRDMKAIYESLLWKMENNRQ